MSLPISALYINFRTLLNPVTAFFTPSRKPATPAAPEVNCKKPTIKMSMMQRKEACGANLFITHFTSSQQQYGMVRFPTNAR